MCAPVALAAVSAGLQIYSGIQQSHAIRAEGDAANSYYQYNAKVAEQNAILAERTGVAQSRAIQDTQSVEGRRLKMSNTEFRSSQIAALAASGISLSSVTAGDIERSTISKQQLDESLLRHGADVRSWEAITQGQNQGYANRVNAAGYRASGAQAKYASQLNARSTLIGSFVGAGTSLLTPLSSSNFAIPGFGGYGIRTPIGTRNMGTFSTIRR